MLSPDETLTAKPDNFLPVLAEIQSRGLDLLSTHPTRSLDQITHDKAMQGMLQRADIILDPTPDEAQIQKKLAGLAEQLKTNKSLVMVASSRPQTLLILQRWFKEHPLAEPVKLAPLSALMPQPEAPAPAAKDEKKAEGDKKTEAKKEEKPDAKKPDAKKSEGAK